MPYIIDNETAADLRNQIQVVPQTPGELNYMLSYMAALYLTEHYGNEPSYAQRDEVKSQLDSATREYYRRIMEPYEELKRLDEENLDPYKDIFPLSP